MAYSPKDMFDDGRDAFEHGYPRRYNPYVVAEPQPTGFLSRAADWFAGYDAAQAKAGSPNRNQQRIEAVMAREAAKRLTTQP